MPATHAIDPLADTLRLDELYFADTQLVERLELAEQIERIDLDERMEQIERSGPQHRWHARAALGFFVAALLAFSLAAIV